MVCRVVFPVLFAVLIGGISCAPVDKPGRPAVTKDIEDLRVGQVSDSVELERMEERIRQLQGKIEELEHYKMEELQTKILDLQAAVSGLQKRVPPPLVVPSAALEKSLASAEALPPPLIPLVRSGLEKIRDGAFDEALTFLDQGMELAHGDRYSAELLFWQGVAHDGLEQNKDALRSYHRIVESFAKSPLVPAALFRQAQVFERMKDSEAYVSTLRKLIRSHPRSSEAEQARRILGLASPSFQ